MSVSGINSSDPVYTQYLSLLNQSGNSGAGSGAQVWGSQSNSGGGNTLMQVLQETLGQMGLSMAPPPPPGGAGNAGGSSNCSTSSNSTEDPRQALGKFMHELFAALKPESNSTGGGTSTPATAAPSYSSLSAKIGDLIQELGANSSTASASSPNSTLSTLQSDFNNLVSAIQGASGNSASSSANSTSGSTQGASDSTNSTSNSSTTLQTFLQDLLANLGASTSASATGNFMNLYW